MASPISRFLLFFLPLALITTALSGLVYVSVQQSFRQSANDPQIQIAEDTAARLTRGETPQAVTPENTVDIAQSLSPSLMVFDDTGKLITSSAILDGEHPVPPVGVFEYARTYGEHRLTWQPSPDARQAIVVVHYAGEKPGFVVVGRSLRETEIRVQNLTVYVGLVWIATLFALFLFGIIVRTHP